MRKETLENKQTKSILQSCHDKIHSELLQIYCSFSIMMKWWPLWRNGVHYDEMVTTMKNGDHYDEMVTIIFQLIFLVPTTPKKPKLVSFCIDEIWRPFQRKPPCGYALSLWNLNPRSNNMMRYSITTPIYRIFYQVALGYG